MVLKLTRSAGRWNLDQKSEPMNYLIGYNFVKISLVLDLVSSLVLEKLTLIGKMSLMGKPFATEEIPLSHLLWW